MIIAFCLFRYFPYGGMQKSFRAMAEEALRRGHGVRVYTHEWQGEALAGTEVVAVPRRGYTTQARQRGYARFVRAHLVAHPVALVVGCNRIPGLDVYYAADNCEAARLHGVGGAIKRWLPRYRHLLRFERAVFVTGGATRLMYVAARQRALCLQHYPQAAAAASTLLPPGIARDALHAAQRASARAAVRRELGADEATSVLLAIGSGFRTKGLARTLRAIAVLPPALRARVLLAVAGQDRERAFARLARRLGIAAQLRFLGGRDDVPRLLAAGDLLAHPAVYEASGSVLLEAAAAGLPVLASAACGFAPLVRQHDFGRVIPEPFAQAHYAVLLREMLEAPPAARERWRTNGLRFSREGDIHDRPRHAVDFLEACARS